MWHVPVCVCHDGRRCVIEQATLFLIAYNYRYTPTAHISLSQRRFHLPLDMSNALIVSVTGSTFVQVEFGRILQKTVVLFSVFKLLWYLVEIIQYCSPDISSVAPHVIVTLSTLRNPTMIAIFLETYSHYRRLYMQ